jgi:Rhs element Vgr protein
VNGSAVPRTDQLLSVSVVSSANHIATARLAYRDGEAATGSFALSNGSLFVPGAEVEILAGSGNAPDLLFKGLVVRQRLKVREGSPPQLVVECRHAATKMSLKRHGAIHLDKTDSDVISQLCSDAGINATIASTSLSHPHLVQFDSTDWDFLVTRAQACGHIVLTRGADLETRAPALSGSPVATLAFGATLMELDAEIDAREQTQAVKTLTWNAADQAVHTLDASPPGFTGPGNLAADDLASAMGIDALELRHAMLPDAEATAVADARFARARLDKVSGRAMCAGLGQVLPGDVVELAGVGDRFNGQVLVTGVRHEMDTTQGWRTHLQFGGVPEDPARRQRLESGRSSSLLAPVHGLQTGIVTDNEDPEGEFRVRVRLPLVDPAGDGVWARVVCSDAGSDRGVMIRPEIDDEVVVGFFDDDPRSPVLLGMLHSSAHAAPLTPSNDNHEKTFKSRSGIQVLVNDEDTVITLSTPGGHSLVLDDKNGEVVLTDSNGNSLKFSSAGITLESSADLKLKVSGDAKLEFGGGGEVSAGSQLKLEGSAGIEVSSGGTAKLKGSLVQIN